MCEILAMARQLVLDAARSHGVRLNGRTREFMEDGFGVRLDDVSLHFSEASRQANYCLGSLAFTVDRHICFQPGFDESCGLNFVRVLAHEVAHLVQKHKGKESRSRTERNNTFFEEEADQAAVLVLAERRVRMLTADASTEPRSWGPEGHYYTVLWASLAAGLSLSDAKRNAFYCQLPDQVYELDATAAGIDLTSLGLGEAVNLSCAVEAVASVNGVEFVEFASEAHEYRAKLKDAERRWYVQTGLHDLTGLASEDEQAWRVQYLLHETRGSFEYGLALHAFGDSYAHCRMGDEKKMYPPIVGHLRDWHYPDEIEKRRYLYVKYAQALYTELKKKWQIDFAPVSYEEFGDCLQEKVLGVEFPDFETDLAGDLILVKTVKDKRIETILDLASSALVRKCGFTNAQASLSVRNLYRPENWDLLLWRHFFVTNCTLDGIHLQQDHLYRAFGCARNWGSRTPFPGRK